MGCTKFSSLPFRHGRVLKDLSTTQFRIVERLYRPNLQVPSHRHTDAHLVITLRGKYVQRSDRVDAELTPWSVSFYPAGESHSASYSSMGARSLHIEISPEALSRVREASPALDGPVICQEDRAASIAGAIYREFRASHATSSLVLDGLILQLFGEISRNPLETGNDLPPWLSRADEMIRTRFTEALTLSEIASSVGVHPVHLAREYRKYYSFTVGEKIRRLRIDYACQQISDTEYPLADIALASGFFDQSHFTVAFKNCVGTPPSVYRRSLRQTREFVPHMELSELAGS